jgi:hypothetical protein
VIEQPTRTWTMKFVAVIVTEVVVLYALWLFSTAFSY